MPLSRRNRKASRKASRKNMRKASRKNMRKASRKNMRKASRKNMRKASRKCWSRKASRKNMRRNRRQHGGGVAMAQSLAQGRQFAEIHRAQHGGAMLSGAPLSAITDSMLPGDLRSFARIGGLDDSIAAAATQRDPDQMPAQKGGRRSKASRKNKDSRKNKGSRKASRKAKGKKASRKAKGKKASRKAKGKKASRKSSRKNRKNRKQYGGAMGAPYNQPTMLLSASEAAKAGTADFSNPLLKH